MRPDGRAAKPVVKRANGIVAELALVSVSQVGREEPGLRPLSETCG